MRREWITSRYSADIVALAFEVGRFGGSDHLRFHLPQSQMIRTLLPHRAGPPQRATDNSVVAPRYGKNVSGNLSCDWSDGAITVNSPVEHRSK
jgi:hypothetical protein